MDHDNDSLIHHAIEDTFKELEENYIAKVKSNYEFGFGNLANVGSCALLTYVFNNKIYVANLGDSKGVLIKDHKD